MARDRAQSNVDKWNLIGGIKFKHVKNGVMFMQCNDWVCSDRTLDVVFIVRDGMLVVWRMRCEKKERKKTHFLTKKK